MYYQNYEDYMRNVLGYPIEQNTYENYPNMPYEPLTYPVSTHYSEEIMELYPETYKLIYPMVCKMCDANTKPITRELLDQMTEEIYLNIENTPEVNNVINVRVNVPKEKSDNESSKINKTNNTNRINQPAKTETKNVVPKEEKEDRLVRRNSTLQDLIKILILNQLLGGGRPQRPPHHSPYPPYPPRPPRPREDRGYNDFYRF